MPAEGALGEALPEGAVGAWFSVFSALGDSNLEDLDAVNASSRILCLRFSHMTYSGPAMQMEE